MKRVTWERKLRYMLGDKGMFERRLKMTHRPLGFYALIYSILHMRTKEANCVHRISASEWNIQIGARSCGVAVSVLNRGKNRRDDLGKKVVNELKHKYPRIKFINIRDSERVQL